MLMVIQYCSNGALNRLLATSPDILTEKLDEYIEGIAGGMRFLAAKNFCHRDLAARNVLVDAAQQPKIADFGLSRDLEQQEFYQQSNANARLPLRWCAPECLNEQKFGEASDVWSYGVVIDEVYNRGAFPYPGWDNSKVMEMVDKGYRLPQAQGCPDLVYENIMKACLHKQPHERPSFDAICVAFNDIKRQKSSNEVVVRFTQPVVPDKGSRKMPDPVVPPRQNPGLGSIQQEHAYEMPVPVRLGDRTYDARQKRTSTGSSDASLPRVDFGATGDVAANCPTARQSIESTLETDACLPYVDFGATDDVPPMILTRDAPKLLAAGTSGGIGVDAEKKSIYAAPDLFSSGGIDVDAGGEAWTDLRQRSTSYDAAIDTLDLAPDNADAADENMELPGENTQASQSGAAPLPPGKAASPPNNRSSTRSNRSSTRSVRSLRSSLVGPEYQPPPDYESPDLEFAEVGYSRDAEPLGDAIHAADDGIARQVGSTLPTSNNQPNPDSIHPNAAGIAEMPAGEDHKQHRQSEDGYGIVLNWHAPR